ncbi:MAG: hypothetical protein ABIG84_02065 [archaeon]
MKGFNSPQETIFTISVILIVAVSVMMTYIYLQTIPIPQKFENNIAGDAKYISGEFAKYVVACYQSYKSSKETRQDCYVLHIRAKETVQKNDILNKIPENLISREYIHFSDDNTYLAKKNTNTTFKITYYGPESRLEITKMDEII